MFVRQWQWKESNCQLTLVQFSVSEKDRAGLNFNEAWNLKDILPQILEFTDKKYQFYRDLCK